MASIGMRIAWNWKPMHKCDLQHRIHRARKQPKLTSEANAKTKDIKYGEKIDWIKGGKAM